MSGRDLGEIKIIAGWSRYKEEMSTGVSGDEWNLEHFGTFKPDQEENYGKY